jgi:GTPase SAR1 family protein
VYAVVITGAPGSGKSTTLEALSDRLHDDEVPHACIDADALSWAHPAPSADARIEHVAALARLYADEGHDLLLLAAGIAATAELEALIRGVQADAAFVVRLLASPETLRNRITAREPAGWSQLSGLLDRAREIGAATAAMHADLVIDTERTRPPAAAAEISARCSRLAGLTVPPPELDGSSSPRPVPAEGSPTLREDDNPGEGTRRG